MYWVSALLKRIFSASLALFLHADCCLLQGLIFVVDSNDRERIEESAEELSKMVSNVKMDKLAGCPKAKYHWVG